MKINDDVIASIDENLVDVSSGWLWSTADVYSPDYTSILEQPVSVESSTLNELRYLASATDITIRETYNNNSLILWAGYVDLIEDPQQIVPNHNDLLNLQGGSSTLSEYYHLSATTYGYVNSLSANAQTQLTNLSATKVDKSIIISAGTGLTGGGSLSANVTISMPTVGTPGTYTKVTTDAHGRVSAATNITSADIPQLPATKIGSGNINNTEFEYLDGVSANIQNQLTNISALDSQKALKTTTITAGTGLTGGGSLSANVTISMPTVGTPGTYTKVTTDAHGRVSAATNITSADIPQLPATKIGSGNISNAEFEYLNTVSANIQTQLNTKSSSSSLTAYQLRSEKGTSLGYAALDTNSKIYTSSIPDAILGQLKYGGSWNANTNIPTLSSAPSMSGTFFIVNVSGTTRPIGLNPNTSASLWPDGNVEWKVGDWIVSDGTYYDKVDNTDAIYSWNGRLGAIVPAAGDYTATQITNTASGGITATTVQAAINELDSEKLDKAGIRINAGAQLTGGGFVSASPTISLATTGTAGTYTKVTTNSYGQVTAGTALTSGDIPQLPATKIGSGNIDNTEFEYLNGVSSNIQTQLDSKQGDLKKTVFDAEFSTNPGWVKLGTLVGNSGGVRFVFEITGKQGWNDQNFPGHAIIHGATNFIFTDTGQIAAGAGWTESLGTGGVASEIALVRQSGYAATKFDLYIYINSAYVRWQVEVTTTGTWTTDIQSLQADPGTGSNVFRPTRREIMLNTNFPDLLAIEALTGTSGFLKKTAANTWTLDSSSYLTAPNVKEIYNWYSSRPTDCDLAPNGNGGIRSFKATSSMTTNKPTQGDSHIIHLGWDNTGGYDSQLAIRSTTGQIQMRGQAAGVWSSWRTVWDDGNLTNLNQLTNGPGYITGNQTITLSGVVTGSGATSIATSISDGALSIAKTSGLQTALNDKVSIALSRVTQGTYVNPATDAMSLADRHAAGYGVHFGRWYNIAEAPKTGYFNFLMLPETKTGNIHNTLAFSNTGAIEGYIGRGNNSSAETWRRIWTDGDFTSTNISNWNTAYGNTHTHSNKSHLDTINQSLATTASPTFDALTVGTLTTGPNKLSILGQYYAYTEYLTQFNGVNAGIDYSTNSFSFAHTDAAGYYIDTPLRISLDVGGELETTLPVVAPSHRFGTLTIPSYPYTLARGSYYYVWPKIQASGVAGTIYLPASPQAGDSFMIFATNGASGKNTVGIMSVSGNGKTIILTNNNTSSQDYGTASAVYMYVNTMFTYDGTYWYAFKGVNG